MENVWPTPFPTLELMTRKGLPLSVATLPVRAGHLAELLVAQGAARVVLVDRHVDPHVLGHLEDGRVHPLARRATATRYDTQDAWLPEP